MHKLICAFAGPTYHIVGNLMSRLIFLNHNMGLRPEKRILLYANNKRADQPASDHR